MSRTRVCSVLSLAVLAAATAPAAFGSGTVLLQEDFNGYADTTAMQAIWGSTGLGTLDSSQGSNGMSHPGGTDNTRTFNAGNVLPTDTTPIVWKFDYFWDGAGNKRLSMGLRDDGNGHALGALLEIGFYNSAYNGANATNPSIPANGSGFAYRTALMPGSGSTPSQVAGLNGWALFLNSDGSDRVSTVGQANTWMTFQATIKASSIDFALDFGRDGIWDSTATVTVDNSAIAYNSARFGGPSNLASGGGGAILDNVIIQTVPPPPTLVGDTNDDGVVDLVDLNNVLNNFGATGTNPGDDNSDGTVDLVDLNNVLNNFGATGAASALSVVPEPTSLSLLAIGATTLLARRRRSC